MNDRAYANLEPSRDYASMDRREITAELQQNGEDWNTISQACAVHKRLTGIVASNTSRPSVRKILTGKLEHIFEEGADEC